MPRYRMFLFNPAGVVDLVREADLPADDDAIAAARELDHGCIVEVMRGRERIARVPPGRSAVNTRRTTYSVAPALSGYQRSANGY